MVHFCRFVASQASLVDSAGKQNDHRLQVLIAYESSSIMHGLLYTLTMVLRLLELATSSYVP